MTAVMETDVLIIGGGPAGCACALYAARFAMSVARRVPPPPPPGKKSLDFERQFTTLLRQITTLSHKFTALLRQFYHHRIRYSYRCSRGFGRMELKICRFSFLAVANLDPHSVFRRFH